MKDSHFESEKHADPTKYSRVILPSESLEKDRLNEKDRDIMNDSAGERFHEIRNDPITQRFISRILKSFINVADIVQIADKYYSHEPHLANIKQRANEDEVFIDQIIIGYIFRDHDHNLYIDPTLQGEHGNLIRENDKHLFFDFQFGVYFWSDFPEYELRRSYLRDISSKENKYLISKLERMSEYFHSDEGKSQVEAAFRATGKEIDELFVPVGENHSFDDFYNELVIRIDTMNAIAHEKQNN